MAAKKFNDIKKELPLEEGKLVSDFSSVLEFYPGSKFCTNFVSILVVTCNWQMNDRFSYPIQSKLSRSEVLF